MREYEIVWPISLRCKEKWATSWVKKLKPYSTHNMLFVYFIDLVAVGICDRDDKAFKAA